MKIRGNEPKMAKNRTNPVALWPVEKLIPYANNPRTHSEAQVAQIAKGIEEFGFTNPILVDTKAGILAGQGNSTSSTGA